MAKKKRIVALAGKCTWDICTGKDAGEIVKETTEELKNIRNAFEECMAKAGSDED